MGTDTEKPKPNKLRSCCKDADPVHFYTRSIDGGVWVCVSCKTVLPKGRKLKSITDSDLKVLIEFALYAREKDGKKK